MPNISFDAGATPVQCIVEWDFSPIVVVRVTSDGKHVSCRVRGIVGKAITRSSSKTPFGEKDLVSFEVPE